MVSHGFPGSHRQGRKTQSKVWDEDLGEVHLRAEPYETCYPGYVKIAIENGDL